MEYSFRERNDLNGTGKRLMVPEPTFCDQISYRDFLKECAASGSGFTEADIDGAVRRIVSRLGFYMELGHSVKIDGLGTFRLKLGLKKGEEVLTLNDLRRRHPTEKVEVDGILFRADSEWVRKMRQQCELVYSGVDKKRNLVKTTPEQRLQMALRYLDTHHDMRLPDYVRLTGLSKTTASLELRRFRSAPESGIVDVGSSNQLRYVKRAPLAEMRDYPGERMPLEFDE